MVESVECDPELKGTDKLIGLGFYFACKGYVRNSKGEDVGLVSSQWGPLKRPATVDLLVYLGEVGGLANG
jgi:hypothetical protein